MGYLPHVQKGDALSASRENAKIDAINALADRLDSLYTGVGGRPGMRVTILNNSNANVPTGGVLSVSGVRISGSFEKFSSVYLNGSVPLTGSYPFPASPLFAFALEGIPAGKIGRAVVPDLYAVVAEQYSSSHNFLEVVTGKFKTADYGRYHILGKSSANDDDQVFCFVYPVRHDGHHVVTLTTGITGPNGTGTATIDGGVFTVYCPLLRGGDSPESIPAGTLVVVSWNIEHGHWEVIEMQCPVVSSSSSSSSESGSESSPGTTGGESGSGEGSGESSGPGESGGSGEESGGESETGGGGGE